MKRATLALLLWASTASALPPEGGTDELGLTDRTEPAKEQRRLEKGTYEERTRVIARAVDAAPHSDEALAILAYAAERARALELREPELVALARGLARRAKTKPARDALFALLTTPPREGFDGRSLHQRIAAMGLAEVADQPDPPLGGPPPGPDVPPDPKPPLVTLDKLLDLADEVRFEDAITSALLRHPPHSVPREGATAAALRIGAKLGDLRWAPVLEAALRDARSDTVRVAALDAARELGDVRALPMALPLLGNSSPTVAASVWNTWVSFVPARALPELERRLARADAPLPLLALARYATQPTAASVATRLGSADETRVGGAAHILATLPNGAGVPALEKLARNDATLHLAIDSLEATVGNAATRALERLLGDPRPTARHEASFALLTRALDRDDAGARRALAAAANTSRPLSIVIRSWLTGEPTPRARAAATQYEGARSARRSLSAQADCARALRADAPACAYAFGASVPRTPSEEQRADLQSLLASPDESTVASLHEGLMHSAWTGRNVALGHALERADATPLRRRLAQLVATHVRQDPEALTRSVALVRSAEPDLVVARILAGKPAGLQPKPRLIRAEPDGRVRCGYLRDEMGAVTPLVIEEGGALVPGAYGSTLALTFTRCDDAVLSAGTLR